MLQFLFKRGRDPGRGSWAAVAPAAWLTAVTAAINEACGTAGAAAVNLQLDGQHSKQLLLRVCVAVAGAADAGTAGDRTATSRE